MERMTPSPITNIHAATAVLPDGSALSPARITIENGTITGIARASAPTRKRPQDIDLGNALILPGFVNAHCHLELTALGPLPRSAFVPWVRELVRRKAGLSKEQTARGILDGAERLLASGVTTVIDHISPETPLNDFESLPLNVIGFGEVLSLDEARARSRLETWYDSRKRAPIPVHVTPHAPYSLHPAVLREFFERVKGPFSIHVAESEDERAWFDAGQGPLADFLRGFDAALTHPRASSLNALFNGGIPHDALLVHGNFLDGNDLAVLTRAKNACVVHCPGSFEFFGHAGFPFEELSRLKIPVALGTDSLASHSDLDFLLDIRLFLARHPEVAFEDVLPMLTTNACDAIGLEKTGRIAVGCRADLCGFTNPLRLKPLEVIAQAARADFVCVGGEFRMPSRFAAFPPIR
jgi:cytosine/adenosine deaminase-related metal-dependent hydrolase